jgi:hypothetical protein
LFATTAIKVSTKYIVFIVFYDLKIKIKNNKYLRIFIINHKNTINIIYPDIQLGCWWGTTFRKNIRPPCQGIFAKIACDFQMICFYSYPEFVVGGFFLPSTNNVFKFFD